MNLRRPFFAAIAIGIVLAPWARADSPFRYPEATHGRGELKYVNNIPVLTVAGSPDEIGAQLGALALKPAIQLTRLADEFLAHYGWKQVYAVVLKTGNVLLARFPPEYVTELDAAAGASGWPRELLAFGNTIIDLRRIVQCSAVILESERSTTGGPLFGRNLDWPPVANLHEFTLVVVYRPTGKRAFASVTFPGILGCTSGMNDAGLAVAMLDASEAKDGSASFNPGGVPTLLLLRRVLEECASVDEAATLIRATERASALNIAICDKTRGAKETERLDLLNGRQLHGRAVSQYLSYAR